MLPAPSSQTISPSRNLESRFRTILWCVLTITMSFPASRALAIPNCSQVDDGFCITDQEGCYGTSSFVTLCGSGQALWICTFYCGGNFWYESEEMPCCCSECGTSGCDCLLAGTMVLMADETEKPIEKVQVGDEVLTFDPVTETRVARAVTAVHPPYDVDHYLVINDDLRVTENHPILTDEGWLSSGLIRAGKTSVIDLDGKSSDVYSVRLVQSSVTVYNIAVDGGTYIADGVVVHNKEDCLQYVQYCPNCHEYNE